MHVLIKTSLGDMKVELFEEEAPITVKNFIRYAKEGHYDHTIFHRVIDNFMIQGGGFTADLEQKSTHEPISNEATNGLENKRGTLAMARTSDVHSGTAQFFINVVDNSFLNHRDTTPSGYGYCVFGNVVEGLEVVDKIKAVNTGSKKYFQDVPVETVEIISVSVLES